MYRPKPEVAAGFTAEDYEQDPVEVWPENLQAVNVLVAMDTQWRVGFSGATGLDYSALPFVLQMAGVPRSKWAEMFEDIRLMEDAALKTMRGIKEE